MQRRNFLLGSLGVLPAAKGLLRDNANQDDPGVVYVAAGEDRFQTHREVLGGLQIDFKVSTRDTNNGLFIIEHTDHAKSGPPKHIHHEQDEWFYVLQGDYHLEIGDKKYVLAPGDSVFAPRKVPHVWAHVGEGQGKLIIGFQPAGMMESFLTELAKLKGVPSTDSMRTLFAEHGMTIVGPPMKVG
ncbi:MAG: cupin domain-containing protein [Saprospiraceae bacterium]|nr:cupin domain-containing protein [Saprospiraceae bacterium]